MKSGAKNCPLPGPYSVIMASGTQHLIHTVTFSSFTTMPLLLNVPEAFIYLAQVLYFSAFNRLFLSLPPVSYVYPLCNDPSVNEGDEN